MDVEDWDMLCPVCHQYFKNTLGLRVHIAKMHREYRKFWEIYRCEDCGREFSCRKALEYHVQQDVCHPERKTLYNSIDSNQSLTWGRLHDEIEARKRTAPTNPVAGQGVHLLERLLRFRNTHARDAYERRECVLCTGVFYVKNPRRITCSPECSSLNKRRKHHKRTYYSSNIYRNRTRSIHPTKVAHSNRAKLEVEWLQQQKEEVTFANPGWDQYCDYLKESITNNER